MFEMVIYMKEIWKDIPSYEGLYQVSNLGKIKSLNYNHTGKEKILKNRKTSHGYLGVVLWKNKEKHNTSVHRLVMRAFVGDSDMIINHKDFDKTNNSLDNLEYCTQKYNVRYSLSKKILQYDLKNNFIQEWNSISDVVNTLKIRNISQCCSGKRKTSGGFIWMYKGDEQ